MAVTARGIVINRNRFAEIGQAIDDCISHIACDTAKEIVSTAKSLAPVDTGALRESIYAVCEGYSGYYASANAARARNPSAQILPELPVTGAYEAGVGICVNYWIFQEFGTRFMPAQPFLTPAVNAHEQKFNMRMQDALKGICNDAEEIPEAIGGTVAAGATAVAEAAEVAILL